MPVQLQMYSFADLWHPWVFAWILLLQVAYLLAVGPMREGFQWGEAASTRQKLCFAAAIWTVYLSEGTPMHLLAENYLFSAHMIQHVCLTMLLPPLLLLGLPGWMLRPVFRPRPVAWLFRQLTRPAPALLLFNLIYSIWHMPLAYQSTLWYHWFHMVQHAVLVTTALLMWWPICGPLPEFPRLSPGLQMLYVFVAGVAQIVVHGMVTFADDVLYQFYANAPRVWAITPLFDQQLAGVIMNIGGMLVFLVAWGIIFFTWAAIEDRWGPQKDREHTARG